MNITYKNYKILQTKSLNYDLIRVVKREVYGKDDNNKKVATGEYKDFGEECGYDMSL